MKQLTLQDLKNMSPDTIFASGIGLIVHPWFNNAKRVLEEDGRHTKVKWVAVRGNIEDWCIYHSMDANICQANYFDCDCHLKASDEHIANSGAKLRDIDKIKLFVNPNEEALKMYRF